MSGPYLLLPLLVLLGSCQESRTPREDAQPEVPEGALFIVDSVPVATIGLDPPSVEYVFAEITGGGIVGDSLIVVVDSGLKRVGVYGFDGDFRRWIVREGEGPGEVEWIHDSGILGDGRVWVYDQARLRLIAVNVDGRVVSEVDLPFDNPMDFLHVDVIGPGADGSWWLRKEAGSSRLEESTVLRRPTELLRMDGQGGLKTIWSGGGDLVAVGPNAVNPAGTQRGFTKISYLPRLLFEATGRGIFMAWSDSGFVDHISTDGRTGRVGRIPVRRIPFLDDDPPPLSEGQQSLYELGREYPQIDRLLIDSDGSPWIYQSPMEEGADEQEVQATLYKLVEQGPVASVRSHLPRIATTMSRDWILVERRRPETNEQYVSLHRLVPVNEAER